MLQCAIVTNSNSGTAEKVELNKGVLDNWSPNPNRWGLLGDVILFLEMRLMIEFLFYFIHHATVCATPVNNEF